MTKFSLCQFSLYRLCLHQLILRRLRVFQSRVFQWSVVLLTICFSCSFPWRAAMAAPSSVPAGEAPEPLFLETYPQLKTHVFHEPDSGFFLGLGLSPVGVVRDRIMFATNFFQVHYLSDWLDWEIFSSSFGFTRAESAELQSTHFVFRSAPKYRITQLLSLGALFGYEYVSFGRIRSQITKNGLHTQEEPFSSRGLIYGVMLTQTFAYKERYLIQVNEMAYKQTYSTTKTEEGWTYVYLNDLVQADRSKIEASPVFMIEASLLF